MEMGSSSATDSGASGSNDSLNGLKFGKKIYFDDGGGSSRASASVPASALPAPPKKGKRVAEQPARCQVEGCKADLTGAKAYYCRHKVCGMHSKSPKVIVAGLEQRFCQQCSRFHLLPEFDQGKRSCRRRLAGHNKRRRKLPPGSLSSRISYQENTSRFRGFLMDFSSHPRLPSQEIWPPVRTGNRVPCQQWQGGLGAHPPCTCVQHSASQALFSAQENPTGRYPAGVSDPSCALSLLSADPWGGITVGSQTPTVSPSSSFHVEPMAHPVITSNYMTDPWGFKAHGSSNSSSSHEVQHSIGSGHIARADSGGFAGELELALQGNRQCIDLDSGRAYGHSHWPL